MANKPQWIMSPSPAVAWPTKTGQEKRARDGMGYTLS
jgi:hypothetical protein